MSAREQTEADCLSEADQPDEPAGVCSYVDRSKLSEVVDHGGANDIDPVMRWQLLSLIQLATARVAMVESRNSADEAEILRLNGIISRVRGVASRMGLTLSEPRQPGGAAEHMTLQEFARYMRWGIKRMRGVVRGEMTEGVHYHRNGSGPRATYVIHVAESERFVRGLSSRQHSSAGTSDDDLARWRASAALRRRGTQ